ncbi:TIGR02186 family protein [Aurantimonas sp. DM33-3]|uniref:TIGR02186 family protein n=1 Tax=Aurantimonas sp. DM33-3 TaxID=2766955 RepID=UPI001652A617|nr:TIGR02186 family protein [Aurantimonas sp. DM33-3]MBC6718861.1 TIGR02186 family protein [Aurantimonas sp. DM33-3]
MRSSASSLLRHCRGGSVCHVAGGAAAFALVAATPAPVSGQVALETFEIGVSTSRIGITSDFSGTRLVVFGALDNADARIRRQQRYDIVVSLVGPRRPVVVRKKERTLGLWINRDSEAFDIAPASYALASTRPLSDITRESFRVSLSMGIDDLRLSTSEGGRSHLLPDLEAEPETLAVAPPTDGEPTLVPNRDEYASALRRIRRGRGLYNQTIGGVEFVSATLFRADLQLPADLPVGNHTVRAFLFRNGVFIRQSSEPLLVIKTGFEAMVDDFARNYSFLYGLFAVVLAIFMGWFGRVVFKRD